MSKVMRAKMQVQKVERFPQSDRVSMICVAAKTYPEDGSDEDNTFAKFSPSGELSLTIANPALIGVIEPGKKFYVDFTEAE